MDTGDRRRHESSNTPPGNEFRRFDPAKGAPGQGDVIKEPENYGDMVKKLKKQDEANIKKLLQRKKVETLEELKKIEAMGIVKKFSRAAAEHKALKDHTVIKEATSPEVLGLKQKLYEEMNAVFQRAMKEFPPADLSTLEKKVTGFRKFKDMTHTQEGQKKEMPPQPEQPKNNPPTNPKKD